MDLIYPGKYDKKVGKCEVHEKFTVKHIKIIREQYKIDRGSKDSAILVHWECPLEVLEEADFYGSTSQMANYIKTHPELKRVWLGTECEMAANLSSEFVNVEFVKSCSVFCQHMRRITLKKILYSLENEVYEVTVDPKIAEEAKQAIERMLAIKSKRVYR